MRQRGVASVRRVRGASIAAWLGCGLRQWPAALAQAEPPVRAARSALAIADGRRPTPTRQHLRMSSNSAPARGSHPTTFIAGPRCPITGPRPAPPSKQDLAPLYAGTTVATVKLPTQPAAELTFAGGIRPNIATIDFDLGVTYFAYPGERLPGETNGINYWEAAIRGDRRIGEQFRIAAGYAYSPNVSNTGAWSQYVAAGVGYDVPARLLPQNLAISFTAAAGYSWFGNQAAQLGGFPLLPISTGRRASPSPTRPSTSICATTTPICRKKTALSLRAIQMHGQAAASISSPTRMAWSRTGAARRSSPRPGLRLTDLRFRSPPGPAAPDRWNWRGRKLADLPVQQSTRMVGLVVNLKTAKVLRQLSPACVNLYRRTPTRLTPPFKLPPALCRTAARATGRRPRTTPALAMQAGG